MIAMTDAGTDIVRTDMSETTPRNTTDVEMTDVKGTETSGEIRREDTSEGKTAEKRRGITTNARPKRKKNNPQ